MEEREDDSAAWELVMACARSTEALAAAGTPQQFAFDGQTLRPVTSARDAIVSWQPEPGWTSYAPHDPGVTTLEALVYASMLDLYLPICSATRRRPITVGHLGQSLDGFIATHSGDSQFVTGPENILHLHRMRALCDVIVVGAGTVAADDPLLTTRRVEGPSPVRVVLDPTRRLGEHYKVFNDEAVETLYVCARSLVQPGEERFGRATLIAADDSEAGVDVTAVVKLLHARGCHRIFVEGGGVTVSLFLASRLLDRLQVAIAPLIIGDGRPAIRVPGCVSLADCRRPGYRVFRMGGDIFFDCDLSPSSGAVDDALGGPALARII